MATLNRKVDVDDSGDNLSGTVHNNAWLQDLQDRIDAAIGPVGTGVWTSYTPLWTSSGAAQPVLGNGVLQGRYTLIGKTCHYTVKLQIGSTTTLGDPGWWRFSLPKTEVGGLPYAALCAMVSGAGSGQPPAIGMAYDSSTIYLITSSGGLVGPTVPFAWATNAFLFVRGTFETT